MESQSLTDGNPLTHEQQSYYNNPPTLQNGSPQPSAPLPAAEVPRGYEPVLEPTKDYLLYGVAVAVLLVAILLGTQTTHLLPQTSTTFSMQRVNDLTEFIDTYDAEDLDTLTNYQMSNFKRLKNLHPAGSHKFSVGCYGPTMPQLDLTSSWWLLQQQLSIQQQIAGTESSISVCRCIDEHVEIAFGNTTFQSVLEGAFVPMTLTALASDYVNRSGGVLRMSGNVPFQLSTQTEFDQLTEIREWCAKAAAPVYTMHEGGVYNSRLMLFIGLSFVFVGLDVMEVRRFCCDSGGNSPVNFMWVLDLIPFLVSVGMLLRWQYDTSLHKDNAKPSFLMTFLYTLICFCSIVVLLFSFWVNVFHRRQKKFHQLWERIFVDVPMIIGLAVIGCALKLQNDEHDEVVLLTTTFVLLAGGLVQHISNLVKEVYDIVCMRFDNDLLLALQSGNPWVVQSDDAAQLDKTRYIMQHFGWTRVYAFLVVLFAAIASWTLSSTTSSNYNPLQFFTQNQYVYFVVAYVIALAGLDMFFEAIPFVTEQDIMYGEVAANRLRKIIICVYIIFLMGSQVSLEQSEQ